MKLAIEGVQVTDGGRAVFAGAALALEPGECVAVVGPNGAGKSVLLRVAAGLAAADAGAVRIDGRDPALLAPAERAALRRRMGYLFQTGALLSNRNLGANVTLPLRYHTDWTDAAIEARVEERLRALDLWEERALFPAQLSVHQRRRGGLARALVLDPELVFLDDPFAGLDAAAAERVRRELERLRARRATLLIAATHLGQLRPLVDRVAVLAEGRLQAPVAPADAAAQPWE
jgi:phospholipid/cholesterol/gamma-HCH transport system ATP-binding protein